MVTHLGGIYSLDLIYVLVSVHTGILLAILLLLLRLLRKSRSRIRVVERKDNPDETKMIKKVFEER